MRNALRAARELLRFDAGEPGDLRKPLDAVGHALGEFRRRARQRLRADFLKRVAHFGCCQRAVKSAV